MKAEDPHGVFRRVFGSLEMPSAMPNKTSMVRKRARRELS